MKSSPITISIAIICFAQLCCAASKRNPECGSCATKADCLTPFCLDGVCHEGTEESYYKCFPKPECGGCRRDFYCASNFCFYGSCLRRDDERSREKCLNYPECAGCKFGPHCKQGVCVSYRCTDGTTKSALRCGVYVGPLLPKRVLCEPCSRHAQCTAGVCTRRRCGTSKALLNCHRPLCASCTRSSQCASEKCVRQMCLSGLFDDYLKCGFLPDLARCTTAWQCRSAMCWKGRCTQHKLPE